jgi:hypothetical protein
MKRRRHEVVDLSLLPPIETLIPDELKNYTKEELSAYLESKGKVKSPPPPKINYSISRELISNEKCRLIDIY